jgi:hypothetical protein
MILSDPLKIQPTRLHHRVSIAGRATEAETGKPLRNVLVTIIGMPPSYKPYLSRFGNGRKVSRMQPLTLGADQTLTRADGMYWFVDLPDGEYSLKATLPGTTSRFGDATVAAVVERKETNPLRFAQANFLIASTTVKGKVTGTGQGMGLGMAKVSVKGSGESCFTDADGLYMLTRIEAGDRMLAVSAQGYETKSTVVKLKSGGLSRTVNFDLTRRKANV